jgi:hypothetical protein
VQTGQSQQGGDDTKEGLIDRKVRENLSDVTYGLVSKQKKGSAPAPSTSSKPIADGKQAAPAAVETSNASDVVDDLVGDETFEEVQTAEKTTEPAVVVQKIIPVGASGSPASVRVSKTVKVGDAPKPVAPSSVKVSATVPVGTPSKQPSIRETRTELKGQVEKARSTPSESGIKATLAVPAAPATRGAAVLGVAKAVIDVLPAEPSADAARAAQQQALYAKAMHAMEVVSSRAADKRKTIQDLQSQVGALRQEVAGLNAQASAPATGGAYRTPDVSSRIQQVSSQLGNTQNKLAMARYGLQTDEAQAQQLRISTNMMRNLAPEVQRGRMPNAIVGLVAQSIPPDVPDPSPQRAVALLATLQPGAPAPTIEPSSANVEPVETPSAPPPPRSYATTVPAATERPAPASTTGLPDSVRARMSRGALTLPQATAVAFSAGQQADRAAGGYQEGVGSPDAREAAFATEGAGARPVIDTIPQSYAEAEAPGAAEDVFEPGGAGASAEFMRSQRELSATQERFQPGTTGGPEAATFIPETERAQRVRPGEEGPDEDALRAAKFQADSARTRAAALQAFGLEQEEEEVSAVKRVENLRGQLESSRRNVSRLIDLFNTAAGAATSETVIGAVIEFGAVLLNMNGRAFVALITYRNKKALIRKIFPPAQFPVEFFVIVAADFLIFSVLFVSFCLMMAPFIILFALASAGVGGILFGIVTTAGS